MKKYIAVFVLSLIILLAVSLYLIFDETEYELKIVCDESKKVMVQELVGFYSENFTVNQIDIVYANEDIWEVADKVNADIVIHNSIGDTDGKNRKYIDPDVFQDVPEYLAPVYENMYEISLNGSFPVILYNREFFEKEKISVPDGFYNFGNLLSELEFRGICPMAMAYGEDGKRKTEFLTDSTLSNSIAVDTGDKQNILMDLEHLYGILGNRVLKSSGNSLVESEIIELLLSEKVGFFSSDTQIFAGNNIMDERLDFFLSYGNGMSSNIPWRSNTAISCMKESDKSVEANNFIKFILSKEGQTIIYNAEYYLPSVSGITIGENMQGAYNVLQTYETVVPSVYEKETFKEIIEEFEKSFDESLMDYSLYME